MALGKRIGAVRNMADHQVEPNLSDHLERRQPVAAGGAHPVEQSEDVVQIAQARHHGDLGAGQGVELENRLGDDAEGALGADEQMLQIIAGVVFAQAAEAAPDAAVGKHHFQTQNQIAGVAVAQHADTAGIGGEIAADAAASFCAEA